MHYTARLTEGTGAVTVLRPTRKADGITLLAAVVGAAPGLVLPFAVAATYPALQSDLLLLAISIAVTTTSLVGAAIEINSIAVIGRLLGQGGHPSSRALWTYRLRCLAYGAGVSLITTPLLVLLYASRIDDLGQFFLLSASVAVAPIIGGYSSSVAGEAIALGQTQWAVSLQATKALLPVLLLVTVGDAALEAVAIAYVLGEVVRGVALTFVCRAVLSKRELERPNERLAIGSLAWQSSSTAIGQAQPVVDRTFIVGGGAGALSSYEMADKLMQGGAQLIVMGLLQRRIGNWARLRGMPRADVGRMLLVDARTVGTWTLLVSVGLAVLCVSAVQLGIVPDPWRTGVLWGAILSASIPTLIVTVACSRLLIIAGKQHLLPIFAIVGVGLTVLANAGLFTLLGTTGIIVAAVVVRAILAALYLIVVRRVLPAVIASDMESVG